jgi:hypothetical protein
VARDRLEDPEAREAQETVLTRCPGEGRGNGDADEAAGVQGDSGFLRHTVFETSAQPGVGVAGNVDCGGGDEVVPREALVCVMVAVGQEKGGTMKLGCSRSARKRSP